MKRWLAGAGIGAGAVLAGIVVWTVASTGAVAPSGNGAEPTPSPVVTTAPPPVPASTAAPGPAGADDEDALALPFVAAEAAARSDPASPVQLSEVATGAALDDLEIGVRELAENGLSQVGTPELISAEIVDSETIDGTPTVVLRVCLDYSTVDLIRADGTSAKADDATERVSTDITMVQREGRWLASKRGFTDDATC